MAVRPEATSGLTRPAISLLSVGPNSFLSHNRLHAIQALHRVNFLKQNGYPIILTAPFNSTGLMHHCGDGRFFEATTTTRHLELAMLDLLDCANNDASCREAYMKWNAFELEEAVAHHNLCGAVHRTRAEWRAHPHGMALAQLPVITIEKIGESAPEPFGPADRPLSGIRILDHTLIIAAPMVGNALAEQGAHIDFAARNSDTCQRRLVVVAQYGENLWTTCLIHSPPRNRRWGHLQAQHLGCRQICDGLVYIAVHCVAGEHQQSEKSNWHSPSPQLRQSRR
jgi:hypothetical protein